MLVPLLLDENIYFQLQSKMAILQGGGGGVVHMKTLQMITYNFNI